MRLTSTQVIVLKAIDGKRVTATAAGFAIDGTAVGVEMAALMSRLMVDDYIDADLHGADEPAEVVLTTKGEQALARAEQESKR